MQKMLIGRNCPSVVAALLFALLSVSTLLAGFWPAPAAAAPPPVPGNCAAAPTMSPTVPADMAVPNSQPNANCFAWQQFIALNWVADTATCAAAAGALPANFGEPNDTAPVVWEAYKEASEVFQKNAKPPSAWCAQQPMPARLRSALGSRIPAKSSGRGYKSLSATSKAGANPVLSDFGQAGTHGAWLTAQNGKVVLYEIRMNRDEFNFINQNRLYDATQQMAIVRNPGFNLPDGSATFTQYGKIGAIELKASWVELPDPATWPKFKTSRAWVVYPFAPAAPRLVTVGLTGLHIIHKTQRSPQFIWATFEHVDNAPSITDLKNNTLKASYTFYNPKCNAATDHYKCNPNAQPPGTDPREPYFPHAPADPYSAPVQVVRQNPISGNTSDDVAGLNAWVHEYVIKAANPDSVYANYQLVDVMWSNNPTPVAAQAQVPLPAGDPQPSERVVANTTMETYFQNTHNCLSCHQSATVAATGAPPGARQSVRRRLGSVPADRLRQLLRAANSKVSSNNGTAGFASDYSFLFDDAQTPAPAPARRAAPATPATVGQ